MKRNAKIKIAALAALVVMAFAAALASFSLANRDKLNEDKETLYAAADEGPTTKTIIDYIIENSNSTDPDVDVMYHIVELGSSATPSGLKAMAEDERFTTYVFNGNKTIADLMTEGKVDYKFYQASTIANEDTDKLADVAKADFIYISNDPANKFSKTNDIGEELYNLLHNYAVGDFKPLVIDSPTKFTGTEDPSGPKASKDLVAKYFAKTGALYNTYGIGPDTTATAFFSGDLAQSIYVGINGRSGRSKWTEVYYDDATHETKNVEVARMLVICGDGSTSSLEQKVLTDAYTMTTGDLDKLEVVDTSVPVDDEGKYSYKPYEVPEGATLYALKALADINDADKTGAPIYDGGYSRRYNYRPEFMQVEKIAVADITASTDLDAYDFVIYDGSCTGDIPAAAYNRLITAMYGSIYILFDATIADPETGGGGGSTGGNLGNFNETNFKEIFYMVATDKEVARYQNIMVTTRGQFGIITGSSSAATAKKIADLINASSWRGIGGPGSTSSNFTVLEVQPCYPIEYTIEKRKGTYYEQPSEILNGKTAEQLGYELNHESKNYKKWYNPETGGWDDPPEKNETEFYAWEISEAMIAEALDMRASDITVVHMSGEEFECNKEDIFGKYDMIFIGGNTSALKPITERLSINRLIGNWSYTSTEMNNIAVENRGKFPVYEMYFHNGDAVQLDFTFLSDTAYKMSGRPLFSAQYDTTGGNSFVSMSGNDLSYNNLLGLKDYVDAGMPIFFSSKLYTGYDQAKLKSYDQNALDPDSNMFKLMKYCDDNHADLPNVVFNVDWSRNYEHPESDNIVYTDNNGGEFGETLTGTVAVLKSTISKDIIKKTYDNSTVRPRVILKTRPAQYNQYDESTFLKTKKLSFSYDIIGATSATTTLYIDDNGNGKFEESEKMASSSTDTLEFSISSFQGGPISWQLETIATSQGTGKKTRSTTQGLSYIRPEEKGLARVLQLYGADNSSVGMKAFGAQGSLSLFFCTECQQGKHPCYYNTTIGTSYRDESQLYYAGDNYHYDATWNGIHMGRHEHTFGIVRYDSNYVEEASDGTKIAGGRDDWDYNFADEIKDFFDFEIDIMSNEEFDELAADISKFPGKVKYIPATDDAQSMVVVDMPIDEYNKLSEETQARVLHVSAVPASLESSAVAFTDMDSEEDAEAMADCAAVVKLIADDFEVKMNDQADGDLADAEEALREYIQTLVAGAANGSYAKKEFARLLEERRYHEFFAIWGTSYLGGHRDKKYEELYQVYAKAKDIKLDYRDLNKKYLRYAASLTENWVQACWDSVIIGPQENFNCQDITNAYGLAELKDYVLNDGQVIIFHEALSRFEDTGSAKLTATLLECFGNDPNHMELDTSLAKDQTVAMPWSGNLNPNVSIKAGARTVESWKMPSITLTPNTDSVTINVAFSGVGAYDDDVTATTTENGPSADGVKFTVNLTNKAGASYTLSGADVTISANATNYNTGATFSGSASGKTGADGTATIMFDNKQSVNLYAADMRYLPYKTKAGYSSDTYFLTNLSYKSDDTRYLSWISDFQPISNNAGFSSANVTRYHALNPYSSTQFMTDTRGNNHSNPYKYSTLDWSKSTLWATDARILAGANKAKQNNSGIITIYPFTLASELNITGSHPSAYAVDVEDADLTVWYSMAGGTYDRSMCDHYAATPKDGKDNYFIYSYGNVYYCGAGHTCVTGPLKDNNDERRLYINIIVNSVRKVVAGPSIDVFDYGTTDNNIIKKTDDGYKYEIPDDLEYPEFTYRATVDKDASVRQVRIYYDLTLETPGGGQKYDPMKDKLIAVLTDPKVIKSGNLVDIGKEIRLKMEINGEVVEVDSLKLDDSYFQPYGGNYTYIVIEVQDSKGQTRYQKIKIIRSAHMFDLT